jgi:hypothetical protein
MDRGHAEDAPVETADRHSRVARPDGLAELAGVRNRAGWCCRIPTPAVVLSLQRAAGNLATTRWVARETTRPRISYFGSRPALGVAHEPGRREWTDSDPGLVEGGLDNAAVGRMLEREEAGLAQKKRRRRALWAPAGLAAAPVAGRSEKLDDATRRRFGAAFGADFSGVEVHPDALPADGRVHAIAAGERIDFAKGRYRPGTSGGDRLIAHELAHVVQQRRRAAGAAGAVGRMAAERDADAAAAAAVTGGPARPAFGYPVGRPQAFEAWEHRDLGDGYGGDQRCVWVQPGIRLSYGQIVALSGDFYRSPEALIMADHAELVNVLKVMETERAEATASADYRPSEWQASTINVDYELATTGHTRGSRGPLPSSLGGDPETPSGAHGEVREGEHVESGAPGRQASFFELAAANPAHYSTENIELNWIPGHALALDLARKAWSVSPCRDGVPNVHQSGEAPSTRAGTGKAGDVPDREPTAAATPGHSDPAGFQLCWRFPEPYMWSDKEDERLEAQAWVASGFADHYLTDAFAAGHLVSGSKGRERCSRFAASYRAAITNAIRNCFSADPRAASATTFVLLRMVSDKLPSLLLKTVHDYYNRNGVRVRNALGKEWTTYGDSHLGRSGPTRDLGQLAVKASRDAVEDVLTSGSTGRANAALNYIPHVARLTSGDPWLPIADFANADAVWDPILVTSLRPDPRLNPLYRLLVGNILPVMSMYAQKTGRALSQAFVRAAGPGAW